MRKARDVTVSAVAVLTLPEPGKPGSLAHNKNIMVDTSIPYVLDVSLAGEVESRDVAAGDILDIQVYFSRAVVIRGRPFHPLQETAGYR